MPFNVDPPTDCENCPYDYCVSYSPRGREDRNPRFTLHKYVGWTCAFDNFVPGFEGDDYDEPYDFYVERMIQNARNAGEHLFDVGHFDETFDEAGIEYPEEFQFSASGEGQVRGDTYEMLVRAAFWNAAAYWNQYVDTGAWPLDRPEPEVNLDDKLCIFTLGDQYTLKRLFSPEYRELYDKLEEQLEEQDTVFEFSKPDALVVRTTNLPDEAVEVFSEPFYQLDRDKKDLLQEATDYVEGHVRPQDMIAAIASKTSGRADRNYQVVFEANAWRTMFDTMFQMEHRDYYMVIPGHYGSDVDKSVSTAWLPSMEVNNGRITARSAIENDVLMESPSETMDWFYETLLPLAADTPSDDFDRTLFEEFDIHTQSQMDDY